VVRERRNLNGLLEKKTYKSDQDRSGRYVWGADLIGESYRQARMPHPTAQGVKQLKLSAQDIDTVPRNLGKSGFA
jgi:hypothetical protein